VGAIAQVDKIAHPARAGTSTPGPAPQGRRETIQHIGTALGALCTSTSMGREPPHDLNPAGALRAAATGAPGHWAQRKKGIAGRPVLPNNQSNSASPQNRHSRAEVT